MRATARDSVPRGFHRNRRSFLAATAASFAVSASFRARAADSFRFGLTPLFLDNDIELLAMFERYFTTQLGQRIALIKRRTYHEISAMLLTGQLDAAWICDDPYVQYQDQLTLLAVPVYHGKPLYQTYVIVNVDSKAQSFDDIAGTVHAFSDPDSTSGYLITRWLLAKRETTPDRFFRDTFFTYGHRDVIRAVAGGLAQSGSIDGYVWDVMAEREPGLARKTRVIWKSDWHGFPPIVTPNPMREMPSVQKFQSALLNMGATELGRSILSVLSLTGFTEATPGLYQNTLDKWLFVKAQA